MEKRFLIWGFALGMTAILLGAFGAHALREILSERQLESFETGVRYQMYHALLLIILSQFERFRIKLSLSMIVVGVLLFSCSIYLLALKDFLQMESLSFLGPITPIGGLLLILGWAHLFVKAIGLKAN